MEQIKKIFTSNVEGEDFHLGATITMIILILTFISSSFYIMISSMA